MGSLLGLWSYVLSVLCIWGKSGLERDGFVFELVDRDILVVEVFDFVAHRVLGKMLFSHHIVTRLHDLFEF